MSTQIFAKSKAIGPPGQPEVYVAAFGKHPAWNDFIDDPGLETDRLIAVKRVLYLEGIAVAIDTGAWDKLEPAQKIDGFQHMIVWRSRTDIVVARLWSSSDGKGRTKYPMVVVAQCKGASLAWVLTEAMPRLERLERRCRDATTQEQVRAALDATRSELRARAAVAEGATPVQSGAVAEVAGLLSAASENGGSADERDQFYRLMYQVERDWSPYLMRRGDSGTATRAFSGSIRSQHVRVPSGSSSIAEDLSRWSHFLLNLVDNATSLTLIRSTDPASDANAWTDIIVGEPEGAQFFCIRASDQSLPLATSIPYTIDLTFKARCDRLVDDSRAGRTGPGSPVVVTSPSAGIMQRVRGLLGGKKRGVLVLLVAAGLVGAGVGVVMLFSGGGSGGGGSATGAPDRSRAQTPREHPPPSPSVSPVNAAPAALPPAEAGEWGRLCAAYHEWFAEFQERLQRRPTGGAGLTASGFKTRADFYATDPYLKGLLDRMQAAQSAGRSMDPWSIAGVPKSQDLVELAKAAPAVVAQAEGKARVEEAMSIIDGFSTRLATDWPAFRALAHAAKSLEASGLIGEAAYLRSLGSGGGATSAEGGPGQVIDAVLGAAGVVGELQRQLQVRDTAIELTAKTGDKVLSGFGAWAHAQSRPESAGGTDLAAMAAMSRSLAKVEEVAGPLGKFLKDSWSGTDAALVATRSQAIIASGSEPTRETFLAWLELAKRSPRLDPSTDPRAAGVAATMLREAKSSRERLEGEYKVAPELRLVALQGTVEKEIDALGGMPFNAETQSVIAQRTGVVESQARELKQGLENAVAIEAARRAGSAREVRDSLEAQGTVVARSAAVNAAWRNGRDTLLKSIPDAEYAQLRVRADGLRSALLALDAAIAPGIETGSADAISKAVSAVSWAERERVIEKTLSSWSGPEQDPEGAALAAAHRTASTEYQQTRSQVLALENDLKAIAVHAAAGASLSEKAADGEPMATVVERARRSPFMRTEALAAAARPLMQQVESLERVESLVGSQELADAADAALPDNWATALTAWRRLGRVSSPVWPHSLAALERESRLSASLMRAVATGAGAARAELEREIAQQRAVRWTRAFAVLSDPGDIEAAAMMASDMGINPGTLDPALRYNLELASLRRVAAGTLSPEQAREHAAAFEAMVAQLGTPVADLPGVRQLMTRLGPISGKAAAAAPVIDVTTLGPGSISGYVGKAEGQVLRFSRGVAGQEEPSAIEFVRVEAPGVETFFVSTTEVSLAQFVSIVDGANAWKDMLTLFAAADPDEDFRRGPRVWKWFAEPRKGVSMRPSDKWLRELAAGRNAADHPRTMAVPPPSAAHPMNYVPPEAALFAAHLAGCRLPTLGEWRAALGMSPDSKDLQRANLRDQQWKAEQLYIADLSRAGAVNWPDDDVAVPLQGVRPKAGADAPTHPWDDGVLWFAPVNAGAGPMRHLVGNVAEYTVDAGPAELLPPAGGASASGSKAALTRQRAALRVVGGSSLSPIELSPTDPFAIDLEEAVGGYADVGFRLAFSAAGAGPVAEPLGTQLQKAIGESTYVIGGERKGGP